MDWKREEEFAAALLYCKGWYWSHNGGRFDTLWFLEWCMRWGVKAEVALAGQRIIRVQVEEVNLCDSAALIPMSLEKSAALSGSRKGSTGLPCVCGRYCGGYCSISRSLTRKQFDGLAKYCGIDCEVDLKMLDSVGAFSLAHDLDLSLTIGAATWSTALRQGDGRIEKANWKNPRCSPSTLYNFVRSGYFGGRTQVFAPRAARGWRADVNSAYPAALVALDLPCGDRSELFVREAAQAYARGQEGIYQARVTVPRMHIPPLPYRGKNRIAYPFGTFVGTWAGNELRYAQSCGVTVEAISSAVVWSDAQPLFRDFCKQGWELRDSVGKSTPFGQWMKLRLNSLTGKFAQRPERERVILNPSPEEVDFCHANYPCGGRHPAPDCCEHKCIGKCGGSVFLNRDQTIVAKPIYQLADCSHVEWAAYLTAHARIQLHKQLVDDGQEGRTALYCDTDSVISTTKRTRNVGKALGQFAIEGRFIEWICIAPKTYCYIDAETGEFIAKSKGIPEAARHFDYLGGRFGGVMVDRGVKTFKTAARSGESLFARKRLFRAIHADGVHFGDRILGDDFLTHPQHVSSIDA